MELISSPALRDSPSRYVTGKAVPPKVAEWLRPTDPTWSWAGSGRAGGIWEPGVSANSRANRRVVLILGRPGSGKTTAARALVSDSGIPVFDRDDPVWGDDDRRFLKAVREHCGAPGAQAVVVRTGSTPRSRTEIQAVCAPSELYLLDTPRDVCVRRVRARGRGNLESQLRAIREFRPLTATEQAAIVVVAKSGLRAKPFTSNPNANRPELGAATSTVLYGEKLGAVRSPAPDYEHLFDSGFDSNRFDAISSVRGNPYPRIASQAHAHWDYSYGNALVNWAKEVLGIHLLPWQQFLLREGCARANGKFKYRTFLTVVARQNGKTLLAVVRLLGGLVLFGERFALGTAQNRSTALESWHMAYDLAEQAGLELGALRQSPGQERFSVEGGRYRIVANTVGGARGLSGVDFILMDEIRQFTNWDAFGAIDKTRRARRDSQLWAITTEGDLGSVVLNKLQTLAKESIQVGEESPLGYWEWSAHPDAHPGRPETWADANPSLGWTLDEDTVAAEFKTDPAAVFEVEVLCRKVASIQAWVKPEDWDSCTSDAQFPLDVPYVFALDAGPELRHVSIVAGAQYQGLHHVELIARFSGPQCLEAAESRLIQLLSRWKPSALVTLAKSPCEAMVAKVGASQGVGIQVIRPAEFARACRAFYAACNQRTIRHPGGPGIGQGLAATKRGPDGLVSSVHKLNPESDNDPALAAILAMWVPTQMPEPTPVPAWTVY